MSNYLSPLSMLKSAQLVYALCFILCTGFLRAEEVLVEDAFADASTTIRDKKIVPKAIDWFSRGTAPLELVPSDDVLKTEYAIKVLTARSKDSPPVVLGHFPTTCLEKSGEYLELSFDYRANIHVNNANSFFVFGLFNDQGNPTKNDNTDVSDAYPGYGVGITADSQPDRDPAQCFLLWGSEPRARLTAAGERFKYRSDALPGLSEENINGKFHFRFRITKTGDGTMALDCEYGEVGRGSFKASANVPEDKLVSLSKAGDSGLYFNTIGLGNTIDRVTAFTFTNLRLIKGKEGR